MELSVQQKAIIAILVAAIAIVLAYSIVAQKDAPVTDSEFFQNVVLAKKIAIIMDVRGADTSATSDKVLQCGTELAGSPKLAGKEISNYGCSEEKCVTASTTSNETRSMKYSEAISELTSGGFVYFHIMPGPNNSTFYKKHAEIAINDKFPSACSIN